MILSCASGSLERTWNEPILNGHSALFQFLAQTRRDFSGEIDRDMRVLTRFPGELLNIVGKTGCGCGSGTVIPMLRDHYCSVFGNADREVAGPEDSSDLRPLVELIPQGRGVNPKKSLSLGCAFLRCS